MSPFVAVARWEYRWQRALLTVEEHFAREAVSARDVDARSQFLGEGNNRLLFPGNTRVL